MYQKKKTSNDLTASVDLKSNQLAQFGNVGVEMPEPEEETGFLFFCLQTFSVEVLALWHVCVQDLGTILVIGMPFGGTKLAPTSK